MKEEMSTVIDKSFMDGQKKKRKGTFLFFTGLLLLFNILQLTNIYAKPHATEILNVKYEPKYQTGDVYNDQVRDKCDGVKKDFPFCENYHWWPYNKRQPSQTIKKDEILDSGYCCIFNGWWTAQSFLFLNSTTVVADIGVTITSGYLSRSGETVSVLSPTSAHQCDFFKEEEERSCLPKWSETEKCVQKNIGTAATQVEKCQKDFLNQVAKDYPVIYCDDFYYKCSLQEFIQPTRVIILTMTLFLSCCLIVHGCNNWFPPNSSQSNSVDARNVGPVNDQLANFPEDDNEHNDQNSSNVARQTPKPSAPPEYEYSSFT
jgi:hypothetical protein